MKKKILIIILTIRMNYYTSLNYLFLTPKRRNFFPSLFKNILVNCPLLFVFFFFFLPGSSPLLLSSLLSLKNSLFYVFFFFFGYISSFQPHLLFPFSPFSFFPFGSTHSLFFLFCFFFVLFFTFCSLKI